MRLKILFAGVGILSTAQAEACATCGLNQSFTPMMLLISSGFFILPLAFVGFIGWKVWKDSKLLAQKSSQAQKSSELTVSK